VLGHSAHQKAEWQKSVDDTAVAEPLMTAGPLIEFFDIQMRHPASKCQAKQQLAWSVTWSLAMKGPLPELLALAMLSPHPGKRQHLEA